MLNKIAAALYGITCYAAGMAALGYSALWLVNLTPNALDAAPTDTRLLLAVLTNVALVMLFALQHSGMARPRFKRWFTRFVPSHLERSTYVLLSAAAMAAIFVGWQPIGFEIWRIQDGAWYFAILCAYGLGWLVLVYATFCINHFDLMGLRQVWFNFRGQPYQELNFVERGLYRLVRHPIYLGWLMVFWFAPVMTVSHLLFAALSTVYIFRAVRWEERDLCAALPEYAEYRGRVPAVLPSLSRKHVPVANSSAT